MLRILLADHHPSALWALKIMLQEDSELEVAGEACDVEALIRLCSIQHPDLILMDRELPGSPMAEVIADLHRFKPRPVVIVMSSDPQSGRMSLVAGADAFVSKGEQPEWLLESLHKFVKKGGSPNSASGCWL